MSLRLWNSKLVAYTPFIHHSYFLTTGGKVKKSVGRGRGRARNPIRFGTFRKGWHQSVLGLRDGSRPKLDLCLRRRAICGFWWTASEHQSAYRIFVSLQWDIKASAAFPYTRFQSQQFVSLAEKYFLLSSGRVPSVSIASNKKLIFDSHFNLSHLFPWFYQNPSI